MAVLDPLIERLGRAINPTLYTHAELRKRIEAGNSFVTRVLAQPRLWLIGGERDLVAARETAAATMDEDRRDDP